MEKENAKPVDEVKFGTIVASIWKNKSKESTYYNVTFTRLYKDGDNWKRTESFGRDDLLLVAKAADLAHTRIYELAKE
jgi:hypothetical protein